MFYESSLTPVRPGITVPPLVDDSDVWAHLGQPDVVFLDVGGEQTGRTRFEYLKGHIPGAVFTDYGAAGWRVTDAFGTPGMLPQDVTTNGKPAEGFLVALETLIGGLGITNDSQVIIATAGRTAEDLAAGTRIYWTLKVLGHDKVSILNGGMNRYAMKKFMPVKTSVNPLETGNVIPKAADFKANPRFDMIATKTDVREAMVKNFVTVDNRTRGEFVGAIRHPAVFRAGSLHYAKNLPYTWLTVNGNATFRSLEDLLKLYNEAGIPTNGPQINFCNTGHEATLGWFVSHEFLGNKQAKVYDGSMAEWSADANMPMDQLVYLQ